MKKFFYLVPLAAMLLSACSNDSENISDDPKSGNVVAFRTNMDKVDMTKATPTDLANFSSFEMNAFFANITSNPAFNFMKGVTVDRTLGVGNTWSYTPEKYWPTTTGTVHFFAYSPVKSRNITSITPTKYLDDAGGTAAIVYTVPVVYEAGSATQEDFIVAAKYVSNASTAPNTALALNFKHALSMATFQAQNNYTDRTIIVDSIELKNLDNTGTLTVTSAATSSLSTLGWTGNGTFTQTYIPSLPPAGVSLVAGALEKLTSANEGLMILPQNLTDNKGANEVSTEPSDIGDPNYKSYVVVYYRIVDAYGIPSAQQTKWIPLGQEFVTGTKYTFQFSFSAGNKVSFSVAMTDWILETPPALN